MAILSLNGIALVEIREKELEPCSYLPSSPHHHRRRDGVVLGEPWPAKLP
jgi:hypothetical protein